MTYERSFTFEARASDLASSTVLSLAIVDGITKARTKNIIRTFLVTMVACATNKKNHAYDRMPKALLVRFQ